MGEAKKFSLYPLHCVIVLLLLFEFQRIPAPAPLTSEGMAVLGILAGLIYGWMFCGLIWPSIFGIVAFAANGLMTTKETLAASLGNDTVWLIAFLLIVSAMIDEAKLTKVAAMWILTKKAFYGKPWLFSFMFLIATFLLSATTQVIAAIVICWGILYQICGKLGYVKKEAYPAYMVLGIVIAGILGTALLPFKPLPYSIMAVYSQSSGTTIGFGPYLAFSSVVCLLTLVIFCLVGKYVLRVDAAKLKALNADVFEPEDFDFHLTTYQKVSAVTLIIMFFLLFFPSILPASIPILGFFKEIGLAGTMMFITAVLVMIRVDGKPLLPFVPMANKGLQWGVLLLVASLMPMSVLIPMESTGIQPWLIGIMMPIFDGRSTVLYLILMVVLCIVLTNFINNGVVGGLFVLITTPITTGMGLNASVMAVIIAFTVHLALISPAGAIWSAILFDNKEWITTKQIYKYAIPNLIVITLLIICVGYPLASIFLG